MTDIKENTSWQNESMHRQSMIDKIRKSIMWISDDLECFDCLLKQWLQYRDSWDSGKCMHCWLEWKDIWLKLIKKKYNWDCMLWDVLDWMYEKRIECKPVREWPCVPWWPDCMVGNNRDYIVRKRQIRRKSIDHQDDFTINYLYQLIKSEK